MDTGINHSQVEAVLDALCFEPRDFDNYEEMLEAKEWAPYRATLIFEQLPDGASRATFIAALRRMFPALGPRLAERIIDGTIQRRKTKRAPQFGPHPTDIFALAPDPLLDAENARLRRLALTMYLEKRAARPNHDPLPAPATTPTTADEKPAAEDKWARSLANPAMWHSGRPHGLLRTVDYDPAAVHTAPTWLVKGLFPDRGLGMLVGESQAGKSFLAIHAAVSIARGEPFFGRKVKAGGVLYIAAEGGSGVLPRIKAADEAIGVMLADNHVARRGKEPMVRAPIKVMTETPNLSREGDPAALARTIRAIACEFEAQGYRLSFVALDTYHAALCGGDEQSAADAGHALKPLREAVEELGLFVLIVHHPGKDIERGARGSSALRAAVDTEIELRVPGADGPKAKSAGLLRRATVTKQRDGAVGDELFCRLNSIVLGHDEDGDAWTTCTVIPCEAPALDGAGKPKGKHSRRFRRAVESGLAEHGGQRAPMKMARGYFNNAGEPKETDDAKRKAWDRELKSARNAGIIETDSCDEWVWFAGGTS